MPIHYNTSTVAHALDVPHKWLDNILSHYTLNGVEQSRQGVARGLDTTAIAALFLAKSMLAELGVPSSAALRVADLLLRHGGVRIADGLELRVDRDVVMAEVRDRILRAVEATPVRIRGRPPRPRSRPNLRP